MITGTPTKFYGTRDNLLVPGVGQELAADGCPFRAFAQRMCREPVLNTWLRASQAVAGNGR